MERSYLTIDGWKRRNSIPPYEWGNIVNLAREIGKSFITTDLLANIILSIHHRRALQLPGERRAKRPTVKREKQERIVKLEEWRMPQSHSEILRQLGNNCFIASQIGTMSGVVGAWKKRNRIPGWRWDAILDLAKKEDKCFIDERLLISTMPRQDFCHHWSTRHPEKSRNSERIRMHDDINQMPELLTDQGFSLKGREPARRDRATSKQTRKPRKRYKTAVSQLESNMSRLRTRGR
jgi:hypothetical protein